MIGAYANAVNTQRRQPLLNQADELTYPISAATAGGMFANPVGAGSRLTGSQRTSEPFDEKIPARPELQFPGSQRSSYPLGNLRFDPIYGPTYDPVDLPGPGSRLKGGDIQTESDRGFFGPIDFPRVDFPQRDLPPTEGAPSPAALAMPSPQMASGMMGSRSSAPPSAGGIFASDKAPGFMQASDPSKPPIAGENTGLSLMGIPDIASAVRPISKIKKPFDWRKAAGVLSDTLLAWSAGMGNPAALQMLQNSALEARDRRRFNEERLTKLYAPEQVGGSMVQWDGTGYKTLYKEPEPFEAYAAALGFKPGTPEYARAMEDYVLRSSGQSAFIRKADLEGIRYGYRDDLQDQRLDQSNTNNLRTTGVSRENNIRSTTTSRDNNIRTNTQSNTNNLRTNAQSNTNNLRTNETARRGQDLRNRVRGRRVGGVPVQQNEPMARDKDGTPMVVRNGQWVRVQ